LQLAEYLEVEKHTDHSSIALIYPALAPKISIQALFVFGPMCQFVRQRRVVALSIAEDSKGGI